MIKDVMVRLDGTAADEVRLAAANDIADLFQSQIIGLFLNVLPVVIAAEDGIGAIRAAELLQKAREAGDSIEARLTQRLARLQKPMELRRFDILNDAAGDVAAREARAADTFVAWSVARTRIPGRERLVRFGPSYPPGTQPKTDQGHVRPDTRCLERHP